MTDDLETQIDQWRGFVQRRQAISDPDIAEMEDHLRERIDELAAAGLDPDEAFLVAVKRMGSVDEISREFAREHSERLWKQLVLSPGPDRSSGTGGLAAALTFAVLAAVAVRLLMTYVDEDVLARNVSLIALPFVTGYLAWTRRIGAAALVAAIAAYAAGTLALNLYPWHPARYVEASTEILAMTHLPIVLWLVVGVAYVGSDWRSDSKRMDFIRFTGEWIVYMALLALGGMVVTGLTTAAFSTLGVASEETIASWVIPMGAAGATVIAGWLVEAKQAVVENIAPVLTKVFTPLTVLMLVALLAGLAVRHDFADLDRTMLIVVDLILALVLGLVLYAISARDPLDEPGLFDRLQLVLLVVALATDAVLLVTMLVRIADGGLTANKVAALGMNLVLLVNLVGSTRLLARFNRGASPFSALERWQTSYLPVYGIWATFVVVALPPIFGFA
ncbi:MAG TPA: permease prefix domain 1-containing protein [Aeromicrobium sp.]|nr:permease prefix domain 1-containing protein [Aeromicrobium sp.]